MITKKLSEMTLEELWPLFLKWKAYEHNGDDFINAKTDFIKKYIENVKVMYGKRYR